MFVCLFKTKFLFKYDLNSKLRNIASKIQIKTSLIQTILSKNLFYFHYQFNDLALKGIKHMQPFKHS